MDYNFLAYIIIYSCCFGFLVHPGNSKSLSRSIRSSDWSYAGPNGPNGWGRTCREGKQQSPINIVTEDVVQKSLTPIKFGTGYHSPQSFNAINSGHTLVAQINDGSSVPSFTGGGLKAEFILHEIHFHWKSEHQIDGERADLEMHLVHYDSIYEDAESARAKRNGLAVLAVFCDVVEKSTSELDKFIFELLQQVEDENEETAEDSESKSTENSISHKVINLLPNNTIQWYRYDGSLTVPDCEESVIWTVFKDRILVGSDNLEALRKLEDNHGNPMQFNYRPIQHLNSRTVYFNQNEDDDGVDDDDDDRDDDDDDDDRDNDDDDDDDGDDDEVETTETTTKEFTTVEPSNQTLPTPHTTVQSDEDNEIETTTKGQKDSSNMVFPNALLLSCVCIKFFLKL